ncbi:hypothetical protein MBLNU230_g6527t1 [Neophaeotheca triangularis]
MADEESPLIQALPPASDYLTYLTIVEYNLNEESLPILHKVLQDEKLTTNIGWDLVHLLVPLLPASEECLLDIARLGNPREVILKVTESLRLIDYEGLEGEQLDEAQDAAAGAQGDGFGSSPPRRPTRTASIDEGGVPLPGSSSTQAAEVPPPAPLPVNQFLALLSMLAILQPRIKTKYPSRFLSTTLQAILASFSAALSHREEMVVAIAKLVKSMSGIQRPTLPSRKSSGMLNSFKGAGAQSASDPEAAAAVDTSPEELAIQTKLLQSFITHIIEEYLLEQPTEDDVPGMAWASRLMEKMHPERHPWRSDKMPLNERFAKERALSRRIDALGQLVTLARDMKLKDETLLQATVAKEKAGLEGIDEEEPPTSADDVPLSRIGSLLLYVARQASLVLYDQPAPAMQDFAIFPRHKNLFKQCMSSPEKGQGTLGTEPQALIDAILALGLLCVENDAVGEPSSDEEFMEYLQVVALLSSNCPSPNLRGHAHYLTSTVLRSQPDERVRLSFIRDTLEHCPFENLKTSAVGWIKGETIEANPPTPLPGHSHTTSEQGEERSVFATSHALDSLAPFLFPSLQADLVTAPVQEAWMTFRSNFSFYLASLNFIYLLLSAKHLHQPLGISDLWTNNDVAGSFLQPLRECSVRFQQETAPGRELEDAKDESVNAELALLDETVAAVTKAVGKLNSE